MSQARANQLAIRHNASTFSVGPSKATYEGSLLDRLSNVDNNSVAQATLDLGELRVADVRESILRELGWLLNTTRLETCVDLDRWPEIRRSVLNFGIPDLAGKWKNSFDRRKLERQLTTIIEIFEPRFRKGSLRVATTLVGEDIQALLLTIEGECEVDNSSLPIRIRARLDQETGLITDISQQFE